MFKSLTALIAVLFLGPTLSHAAAPTELGKTGVGVQVGSFSALTVKRTINERTAWDASLGTQGEDILATADYLWYTPQISVVHPYLGVGGGLAVNTENDRADDEENLAGVGRIPLGVSYYPMDTNLNASFQVTPMFRTLGETEVAAAVSLLYYFQ